MLKILHKGLQINLPLNPADITGNAQVDSQNAYILGLVSGRVAAMGTAGVQLADAASQPPLGFVINDAAGYYFENAPALASGLLPITFRGCVVITDAIASGVTVAVGDLIWLGTGATAGLLTNVKPGSNAVQVGIALSTASAAAPELTLACTL